MNTIKKQPALLLDSLIEALGNGVLLLTTEGTVIYGNSEAERMCKAIDQNASASSSVPKEVWSICRKLIEGRNRRLDYFEIIESEICLDKWRKFRIRVKWHSFQDDQSCLFVMLENQFQSLQNQAIFEADEYCLTPGEARVWLLHRTNHNRKEIGKNLYITLNTVKKHLKSIKAKKDSASYQESCV